MASKIVKLQASDGSVMEAEEKVAFLSPVIADMVLDMGTDAPLRLPASISSPTLSKVLEFCTFHASSAPPLSLSSSSSASSSCADQTDRTRKEWNSQFIHGVNQQMLLDLTLAANDLKISELLDLTTQTIADQIEKMSVAQVRAAFNIL